MRSCGVRIANMALRMGGMGARFTITRGMKLMICNQMIFAVKERGEPMRLIDGGMMGLYDMLLPESPYVFYDNDRGYCINTADVLTLITQLSVTGHWIPCKDRLPTEDGDYFVTVDSRYIPPNCRNTDKFFWHDGKWAIVDCEIIEVDIPVLAWMPLPEGYVEDNNE